MKDFRKQQEHFQQNFEFYMKSHPHSDECNLYIPVYISANPKLDDLNEDVVGSFEREELEVSYGEAIPTRYVKLPNNQESVTVATGDQLNPYSFVSAVAFLILHQPVPDHSVIQYATVSHSEEILYFYYLVVKAEPFGEAPIFGFKYLCIPFNDTEELLPTEENEE